MLRYNCELHVKSNRTPFIFMCHQELMGRTFDYKSDEFTLEKIIEWGFAEYAERINEISGAASKELAIEQGLADIASNWETMELDIVPHKEAGHFKLKVGYSLVLKRFHHIYVVYNVFIFYM